MPKIKHLESKFSIASYDLIKQCDGAELRLYLWLKLWAINKHEAFPSLQTIEDDLQISRKTIIKKLKEMEKSGRLKVSRTHRQNNVYDITAYDEMILGCSFSTQLSGESPLKQGAKSPLQRIIQINEKKDNHIAAPEASQKEWNLKTKLWEMYSNTKRPDLQVISMYYAKKKIAFQNAEQLTKAIKRDVRAAGNLNGYTKERIKEVLNWLEANADFKWTLETVHKYIDEDFSKLAAKGRNDIALIS